MDLGLVQRTMARMVAEHGRGIAFDTLAPVEQERLMREMGVAAIAAREAFIHDLNVRVFPQLFPDFHAEPAPLPTPPPPTLVFRRRARVGSAQD